MRIFIRAIQEIDCECDVLILPFNEGRSNPYRNLKPSLSRLIARVLDHDFSGKNQEVLLVPAPEDIKPARILFLGLGKKEAASPEQVRQAGGKALAYLRDHKMRRVALSTILFTKLKRSAADFIEGALLGLYQYEKYRSEKQKNKVGALTLIAPPHRALTRKIRRAEGIASAVVFARDLVNAPANDLTPRGLARVAKSLKGKSLTVRVLEKKWMERLKMGAYLAVSYGSAEPPTLIVLEYRGSRKPPVVIIGKSITFDSGGLSLKPADSMEKMKYDMAGGAAVLGVMKVAAELRLPVHLVGVLPATENLPGGRATKPGDVVRSMSGKTIEIVNTDAEGRLALADALTYAQRFKPAAVIDIATLTGACAVAFGGEAIAMMGNDRKLLDAFRISGESTYERVWEMPLYEEYKEYLKSDIADMKNVGTRIGSLMASAYFLSQFAGDTPWVHLDIAGTAWVEKDRPYIPKGASGIGVRLIYDILEKL